MVGRSGADGDGFGSRCDPDFNNDGAVNFADLGLVRSVSFTTDPDANLDGGGAAIFPDLSIMRAFFLSG